MKPVLYQFPHSPYCLPIARVLSALGVDHELRNVSNSDRSENIRLTGGTYYQVPVLRIGDRLVHDSGGEGLDIARHIDREYAAGRLFPSRLEGLQGILVPYVENTVEDATFRLADIHYLADIADPVERLMIVRHKERRYGRGCVERWRGDRAALMTAAIGLLRPFDSMAAVQTFLLADTPVYADFALYGILANLTYREWNPFPPGLPALERWFSTMQDFRFDPV